MAKHGLDYFVSAEKLRFDERSRAILWPMARAIGSVAAISLKPRLEDGTDPYYEHVRLRADGSTEVTKKVRTMSTDSLEDGMINFHKQNPRIVSGWAHLLRDVAVDELPQIGELGRTFSVVGLRSCTDESLEYFLSAAKRRDAGVAREWESLYFYPSSRHGLTGPGQQVMVWHEDRDPTTVHAFMRADVDYYPENCSMTHDLMHIITTPPQLMMSAVWKLLQAFHGEELPQAKVNGTEEPYDRE